MYEVGEPNSILPNSGNIDSSMPDINAAEKKPTNKLSKKVSQLNCQWLNISLPYKRCSTKKPTARQITLIISMVMWYCACNG